MPNLGKRKVASKSNVERAAHVKQARLAAAAAAAADAAAAAAAVAVTTDNAAANAAAANAASSASASASAHSTCRTRACVCMCIAHSVCPASFLSSHRQADHASGGTVNFLFMVSSWYLHGCIVTTAVTTTRALVCPCACVRVRVCVARV